MNTLAKNIANHFGHEFTGKLLEAIDNDLHPGWRSFVQMIWPFRNELVQDTDYEEMTDLEFRVMLNSVETVEQLPKAMKVIVEKDDNVIAFIKPMELVVEVETKEEVITTPSDVFSGWFMSGFAKRRFAREEEIFEDTNKDYVQPDLVFDEFGVASLF
jgi:hypothetical protein